MRRLQSLADLAELRHQWDSPVIPASPSVPSQPVRRPHALRVEPTAVGATKPEQQTLSTRVGFIAFLLGPTSGFVSAFGTSVLSTTFRRTSAWVFPDRPTLRQALYLALGLNHTLYEVRILPAIGGMPKGARS